MRPRLRTHVQVTRQHYRGRRWHVVHDPTSNQFYRLNPIAYDFVGMLDGSRDVESAWNASLTKFGDAAPTQNEIIQLISQLYQSNLLACDTSPETEQLLQRGRDRFKRKAAAQAIGIMYFKIRAFNPDRMLSACEPILRPLINIYGFIAWCILLAWALFTIIPHWEKLSANFNSQHLFEATHLWLVPVAFILTKAIHEFGHGIVCKRFGGQVPEFGFMLLVMLPSPYVDASAAWAFPSKWKRMAVGGAGMMFELVVASVATFVWVYENGRGQGESIASRLSYNIMLSASISTVLFNINPLMRFDGYYMLADLLETPNLAQRANRMLMHYIQKHIYRLKNLTPPTTLPGETAILTVYGVLAFIYRIILFISITLYVMGQFFAIGLFLAIWTSAAWFLIPIGKFIHWLAAGPAHSEHRTRAVAISFALIAISAITLGLIPMPDRRRGTGVVTSENRTGIFFETDGFVVQAHKKPGEHVKAGEPIVTLESAELIERRRGLVSQIDEFALQERAGIAQGEPAILRLASERIRVAYDNLAEVDRRIASLVVRAPHDGVIVQDNPEQRVGGYVKRGEPVCQIVDTSTIRIDALFDQRQAGWMFDSAGQARVPLLCDVRLISDVSTVAHASRFEPIQAGQNLLPSPALATIGGGLVETEARDQTNRTSKRPQLAVRVYPDNADDFAHHVLPGERVKVRFKLEPKPLLSQWIERLSKEIQGRVNL
jgi:putative peptide zinc metalloprotease protein